MRARHHPNRRRLRRTAVRGRRQPGQRRHLAQLRHALFQDLHREDAGVGGSLEIEGCFRRLIGGLSWCREQECIHCRDVDHMALPRDQSGDQRERKLHGAEVIQILGPRIIVQAVERVENGTPDGFAGVVDDNTDSTRQLKQLLHQGLNFVEMGQIAGQDVGSTALGFDSLFHFLQFIGGAHHQEQMGFRFGQTLHQAPA